MPKSKVRKPAAVQVRERLREHQKRLVTVEVLDDGRFAVHHQGVTQLESPSILRVAAQIVERQLGIRE